MSEAASAHLKDSRSPRPISALAARASRASEGEIRISARRRSPTNSRTRRSTARLSDTLARSATGRRSARWTRSGAGALEELHPIAAGALGRVQGGVGRAQQVAHGRGVVGATRHPHADRQRVARPLARDAERDGGDAGPELLADEARVRLARHPEDHDELLAAGPRDDVRPTDLLAQAPGDLTQR